MICPICKVNRKSLKTYSLSDGSSYVVDKKCHGSVRVS